MNVVQFIAPFSTLDHKRRLEILEARSQTLENLGIRYNLKTWKCEGDEGYFNGIQEYWNAGDLVIIEQDMVVTVDHIESFLTCEYPFCTIPYRLQNGHWSLFDPVEIQETFFAANGPSGINVFTRFIDGPVKYSQGSALGLVRITEAGQKILDLDKCPNRHWSLLDMWISYTMKETLKMKWHVHYPPVHQIHS